MPKALKALQAWGPVFPKLFLPVRKKLNLPKMLRLLSDEVFGKSSSSSCLLQPNRIFPEFWVHTPQLLRVLLQVGDECQLLDERHLSPTLRGQLLVHQTFYHSGGDVGHVQRTAGGAFSVSATAVFRRVP